MISSECDDAAQKCFEKILQEYRGDTRRSISAIALKHLSDPKLDREVAKLVTQRVVDYITQGSDIHA